MTISIIVAAAENNVIGKNNQMVWHLPEDFRFFKNKTWGLPLIMGRKTFEAMGEKELAGRFNIVITRQSDYRRGDKKIRIAGNLDEAIEMARQTDAKEAFIGGGGQLYAESMRRVDRVYLTRIKARPEGDAFFPEIPADLFELTASRLVPADEKNAFAMDFQTWEKKDRPGDKR